MDQLTQWLVVVLLLASSSGAVACQASDPSAPPQPDQPPIAVPANPPAGAPLIAAKRVHIYIDRRHEFGGNVVAQDSHNITLERDGEKRDFVKGQVLAIVPLLEDPGSKAGYVHLRDGSAIHAFIVDDGFDAVTYEAAGIRTSIPRAKVFRVTLEPPFEARYEALRSGLKETDHGGRLSLCRWLYEEGQYELARAELKALLADADIAGAAQLLKHCEAQLALGTPGAAKATGTRSGGGSASRNPPANRDLLPKRILTDDEVNIIRVYELEFSKPLPVFIERAVITELIAKYASSSLIPADTEGRNRIYNADPREVARLMFDLKAREFYPNIKVNGEPQALAAFWHKVHDSWLIPNCATSKCHGGVDAGGFFLHQRDFKDTQVRYTNLMILLKSRFEDGPMIDFDDPRASLLVQYALPPSEARHPHPDVRGWHPVFVPTATRLLEETERWIRLMFEPRPDYPIDYEPPVLDVKDRGSDATNAKPER